MKSFILDKRLVTKTTYYTESDTALVIQAIGTDDTAKVTVKVDGIPSCETISDIANVKQYEDNRNPLFDLRDLTIIVPPDKTFYIDGTASKYVRIIGSILKFAPGESLPAGYVARWNEQGKLFYSYQYGAVATETAVPAGTEITLDTFTCPAGEKWIFDSLLMAIATETDVINYDLAIRVKLQDVPFDNLVNAKMLLGITQYSTGYLPTMPKGEPVLNLKDKPITVGPGETLLIRAVNTSDASITVDDATSKSLIVGRKEYLKP